MDHRGHGHAEDGAAVVGAPGALGHVAEVVHARQIVETGQVTLLVQIQGGVEGAAGDQIAGRARFQLAVEHAVVFGRRRRLELDINVRVILFKSRNDLVLPDGQVVVTPAFDHQRDLLHLFAFVRYLASFIRLVRYVAGVGRVVTATGNQQQG